MLKTISEIEVSAPASQVYSAFTNASALRLWMCDVATVDPHPNGRMYLWWNGDFYSSGIYLALEPEKMVKFRWYSSIDPGPTEVQVFIESGNTGTRVRMEHTIPEGQAWDGAAQGFKSNWDQSLENLKSVLENGIDLRIADRPMLGILPGDFTPEQARNLGIPVKEGLRLDGVVDGLGAAAAGLQKDDVIIELNGKKIGSDFGDLRNAIAGKKGGDPVEVTFYRGAQKKTVRMELSRRKMPEVPFNAQELARQGRLKYQAVLAELEECFKGISDKQANVQPKTGEWSALETIAHLIHTERYDQFFIVESIDGFVRQADNYGSNIEAQVQATVTAYPTIATMLDALRRSAEETLALIKNLPDTFVANKGSFYQVGSLILQRDFHYTTHIAQIKATLKSVKEN